MSSTGMVAAANAVIEAAWIAATVWLVASGHTGWAVATFIAALFSRYSVVKGSDSDDR